MLKPLNLKDLFLRILVIALTGLVLIIATSSNSYDLHLKIRKTQPVSEKIVILELSPKEDLNKVIQSLKDKKVSHILINSFLGDSPYPGPSIFTYSTSESNKEYIHISLKPDTDGQVRRFSLNQTTLTTQLSPLIKTLKQQLINLRGPAQTFEHLSFYDLVHIDLTKKTVIIKPSEPINTYTTPLGVISESELIANILDNYYEDRFIPYAPLGIQALVLFILLTVTILLLLYLPSTLALMGTLVLGIFYISLSLWMFDNFYLWTPIISPIIQIVLAFLLISNYKHILNEKTKWNLEKESHYFDEVEEMKTNFLSLFSHDLKTPLSKIIGITDTLRSKSSDSDLKKELDKIYTYSKDLDKYIKRILKMSQVQSKNISLNKSPEDLNILIEKSIQQNQLFANEKNITLTKKLNPLFMIEIDAALIQEVIINFLENAITYSPNNSEITIFSQETENYIKVSVTDQGKGLPKEVQDSIWEKYYRFDSSKAGYGLGLFLSRYVITLHGGQVFLNSKVGQGSEFGFILPL